MVSVESAIKSRKRIRKVNFILDVDYRSGRNVCIQTVSGVEILKRRACS